VRSGRGSEDATWQAVARSTLGDDLLLQVLSEIVDRRERALLFAHVALELPLASVARTLRQDRKEVEANVNRLLDRLKADEGLRADFSDVHWAGRPEHYLELATKLGLQDWFCASCKRFMMQPAVGRPRITCGDYCRKKHNRAGRQRAGYVSTRRKKSSIETERPPALATCASEAAAMRIALRAIVSASDARERKWATEKNVIRNRAIILLGLTCPVQVSAATLVGFTKNDVIDTRKGLEVLFRWGASRTRQYVTIPPDTDRSICPVLAVRAWHEVQRARGRGGEKLFEVLPYDWPRFDDVMVAALIERAARNAGLRLSGNLGVHDLLPAYLKEISANVTSSD
jgi:hypothetical protein